MPGIIHLRGLSGFGGFAWLLMALAKDARKVSPLATPAQKQPWLILCQLGGVCGGILSHVAFGA